jgi:hypothetical protein
VGFGLIVEYWQEIVACIAERRWPQLPLVGGFLVTLGVLGEVWFGRLALRTADDISERADSDVAMANERSVQALERIAIAEAAAAEANLARARIEEQLFRPHLITNEARGEISRILGEYSGAKRVDIFVYDSHIAEVFQLADSLSAAFSTTHWSAKMWIGREPRIMGAEVVLSVRREYQDEQGVQKLASALSGVIFHLGIGTSISIGGFSGPSPDLVMKPLAGWGFWDAGDVATLRIQVGHRQLSSELFGRPLTPPQA